MRLLYTLLIIVVVIGFIYAYRSDVGIDTNLFKGISQIRQQLGLGHTTAKQGSETTKIYKYRNAKGEWVYTNQPPATTAGTSTSAEDNTVLEYRNDVNVLPAPSKQTSTAKDKHK